MPNHEVLRKLIDALWCVVGFVLLLGNLVIFQAGLGVESAWGFIGGMFVWLFSAAAMKWRIYRKASER